MRVSDNSIVGSTDEITSDVIIPDTRIPSESETGTSSSSGSITTEFNIDEQDDWLASLLCSSWEDGTTGVKTLELGTSRDVYMMVKKYPQAPAEWKKYTGLQLNQLQMTMDLNSFVQMSWDWLGGNNPKAVTTDPFSSSDYASAMTTKSFKTLQGSFYLGDTQGATTTQIRQASNITLTINNNKERTDALFESDAIEMSDGDFAVTGSFDIWKADDLATTLENFAIDGTKKWLSIKVQRTVGSTTTSYEFQLKAKLMTPTESKDGNKLKTTINFGVYDSNAIKIIKTVA